MISAATTPSDKVVELKFPFFILLIRCHAMTDKRYRDREQQQRINISSNGRGQLVFNPFDVVDDASASLDDFEPHLRLIFKRILKKELATRSRGLQELCEWLQSSSCTETAFSSVREQLVWFAIQY